MGSVLKFKLRERSKMEACPGCSKEKVFVTYYATGGRSWSCPGCHEKFIEGYRKFHKLPPKLKSI